jgi:CMP-N-acetylneuraminic acid synthetase
MIGMLLIGKHSSGGVPGKNYMPILGRPLVEYALIAAQNSKRIDKIFVSTDSPNIVEIAKKYDAEIIERPDDLAKSESPTELAYAHGYEWIKERYPDLKYLSLMFANSPCVMANDLDKGFDMLDRDDTLDSVISMVKYNMFAPMRARKMNADGTSEPVLDLASLGLENTFHRDAQGDIYYVDFGVQCIRPERCLEKPTEGALPFVWMGQKQGAIEVPGGFDVDAPWQIAAVEHWLRELGFSYTRTPYDK